MNKDLGAMMSNCRICGEELKTDGEIIRGVCNHCDTLIMHDKFDGEPLLDT